jgi:hypothetical protein
MALKLLGGPAFRPIGSGQHSYDLNQRLGIAGDKRPAITVTWMAFKGCCAINSTVVKCHGQLDELR